MMTVTDRVPAEQSGPAGGLRRADGSPVRVLVVDDEPSLAELLASVLRYEGWEIRTAADGAGAVKAAREFEPDAVVLDIMLPDFDGLEVLRRLRASQPGRLRAVPDGAGLGGGPDQRDHRGRRRLRNQAVQSRGGPGPAARAAAPGGGVAGARRHGAGRGRPDHGRGRPRGAPGRHGHRPHGHRVRAAPLPDAQPAPGAVQGADPGPGLELRLRRPGPRRGAVHQLPAQEDRQRARSGSWTGS
jgi:CheY-like chemotaxis protein